MWRWFPLADTGKQTELWESLFSVALLVLDTCSTVVQLISLEDSLHSQGLILVS